MSGVHHPEAVWIVDAETLRIVEVNDAAAAMIGMTHDEMIGRGVTSLAATPEDLAFWADAHAGLDDRLLSDSLLVRADGEVLKVTRRISALQLKQRRVFVVAIRER